MTIRVHRNTTQHGMQYLNKQNASRSYIWKNWQHGFSHFEMFLLIFLFWLVVFIETEGPHRAKHFPSKVTERSGTGERSWWGWRGWEGRRRKRRKGVTASLQALGAREMKKTRSWRMMFLFLSHKIASTFRASSCTADLKWGTPLIAFPFLRMWIENSLRLTSK